VNGFCERLLCTWEHGGYVSDTFEPREIYQSPQIPEWPVLRKETDPQRWFGPTDGQLMMMREDPGWGGKVIDEWIL
jgi:hypothetical protein